jgi:D-alanine-D-alanine ligase
MKDKIRPKIKLALLSGGVSGEREISLKTGEEIYHTLDKNKYEVFRYDPATDLKKFMNDAIERKFDLVFPALHGPFGEDGKLQGMLDLLGVPYVFSGTLPSALAMNKYKTKIIAQSLGMDTARGIILRKESERGDSKYPVVNLPANGVNPLSGGVNNQAGAINNEERYDVHDIVDLLSLPIVIKPVELGSSVGVSIAADKEGLKNGIAEAFRHGSEIMLEQYIRGKELAVAVITQSAPGSSGRPEITTTALPVIEIIPKISSWFDYRAKYEKGGSREICPARIADTVKDHAQRMAVKIFKAIGCKDVARSDFILGKKDGKLYFLEINTIPGMTKESLVPKAAKAAGISFGKFLDQLIENAIRG